MNNKTLLLLINVMLQDATRPQDQEMTILLTLRIKRSVRNICTSVILVMFYMYYPNVHANDQCNGINVTNKVIALYCKNNSKNVSHWLCLRSVYNYWTNVKAKLFENSWCKRRGSVWHWPYHFSKSHNGIIEEGSFCLSREYCSLK